MHSSYINIHFAYVKKIAFIILASLSVISLSYSESFSQEYRKKTTTKKKKTEEEAPRYETPKPTEPERQDPAPERIVYYIKGKVIDSDTRKALYGAQIRTNPGGLLLNTDRNGTFTITTDNTSPVKIEVRLNDYQKKELTVQPSSSAQWQEILLRKVSALSETVEGRSIGEFQLNLDLEIDLNTTVVEIASRTKQAAEEAPSIISVVTKEEIERYGCRDITDILRIVPGFEFGVDILSNVAVGMRGIWIQEGKYLFMINSIMMNDLGYGNLLVIGTFPAAMIERVEILRGPGSSLYGGFAEVAVINIITHNPESLNGIKINANGAVIGNGEISRYGNVSAGGSIAEIVKVAVDVGYGAHPTSSRTYTDFKGDSFKMGNTNSFRRWQHFVARAETKNISFHYINFLNHQAALDGFNTIYPKKYNNVTEDLATFNQSMNLRYKGDINERIQINGLLERIHSEPVSSPHQLSADGLGTFTGSEDCYRYRAEVGTLVDFYDFGDFTGGMGYLRDITHNISRDGRPGMQTSQNPADTTAEAYTESFYIYGQHVIKVGKFNFTGGLRGDFTTFGTALAPRLGITGVFDRFNAKLLYGRSYRIPTTWQVYSRVFDQSGSLVPEITNTIELELGYKLNKHISFRVNGFFINIDQPIVYIGSSNSYQNFGQIQSIGSEGEIQIRYTRFGGFFNFSYDQPGSATTKSFMNYNGKSFLALPSLKLNFGGYAKATSKLQFGPSLTVLGNRVGQSQIMSLKLIDGADETKEVAKYTPLKEDNTTYDPVWLLNLNILYKGLLFENLDASFGIHNLLGSDYIAIQPYYGGHAPLPVHDRQFTLNISYNFK